MTTSTGRSMSNTPHTFAVLTRGMYDESPFLEEFVGYYLSLGFDQIYFINSDIRLGYVSQCLNPEMSARVTVIDSPNVGPDWQEPALNNALRMISETWVLVVDLDEFLVLHGQSIQEYVSRQSLNCSKLRFRWLLALSTNYCEASVFDLTDGPLYASNTGKVMVRRSCVGLLGLHDASTIDGSEVKCTIDYAVDPFILHVACRGFLDLISRIVGRNYGNDKAGTEQEDRLRRFLGSSRGKLDQFPFRFHMYRIQLTSAKVSIQLDRAAIIAGSGTRVDQAVEVWSAKMVALGCPFGATTLSEIEEVIESMSDLRARLFRCMPPGRFIRMHLDEGMSYVNATRAYVRSLPVTDARAISDGDT